MTAETAARVQQASFDDLNERTAGQRSAIDGGVLGVFECGRRRRRDQRAGDRRERSNDVGASGADGRSISENRNAAHVVFDHALPGDRDGRAIYSSATGWGTTRAGLALRCTTALETLPIGVESMPKRAREPITIVAA